LRRKELTESWKGPEEGNMSIGELAEWLQALPPRLQHLPVIVTFGELVANVNPKRLTFSDGELYYTPKTLSGMTTFQGISLEIDANMHL
jgi:hypothetical protein